MDNRTNGMGRGHLPQLDSRSGATVLRVFDLGRNGPAQRRLARLSRLERPMTGPPAPPTAPPRR